MDTRWALRSAFNQARGVKNQQDVYCAKAESGLWGSIDSQFPENKELELLVDVLRGRVKVPVLKMGYRCMLTIPGIESMLRGSRSGRHGSSEYKVPRMGWDD